MMMGELIEHGKTSDVFLNPKNPQTEMYVEGRYG
jgi:ABC-type phosphate transport system ATPase subunit